MTQPFEDIRVHHADVAHFVEWKKRVKADVYLTEIGRLLSAVDALVEWGKALDKTTNNDADMRDYDKLSEAYDVLSPELKEALK